MNFSQLKNFLKLCEVGSFSKASQDLYISQQGLSHSIRTLEDELNIQLFDRTARGVRANEYGKALYPFAESIVKQYQQMLDELDNKRKYNSTILTVGLPYGIFSAVPFNFLMDFQEKHPEIALRTMYYQDSEFESQMLDNYADVGIANVHSHLGRSLDEEKFEYINLIQNELCAVVNLESPLAQKDVVNFADLKGTKIAVYSTEFYNDIDIIREECKQHGLKKVQIIECSEQSTLLNFAKQNYGVAVMAFSLDGSRKSKKTVELPFEDREKFVYDICLMSPKDRKKTDAVWAFIDYIKDAFGNISE